MKKLLLLICFLLSACSNIKPQDCQTANWRDIGYNDATQGRADLLKNRTQACTQAKVIPNKKEYLAGYEEGAKQFCTYRNGFLFGQRGYSKEGVCLTQNLAKPFYSGYKDGLEVYREDYLLRDRSFRDRRFHNRHRYFYNRHRR